jgi:hypothetical protein
MADMVISTESIKSGYAIIMNVDMTESSSKEKLPDFGLKNPAVNGDLTQ